MKKIVNIIARLNIGGPALHLSNLFDIDQFGYETVLIYGSTAQGEGDMSYLFEGRKVRLIYVPELGREISPIKDLLVLFNLFRILKREKPDIVHTHTAKAGMLGRVAAKLAGSRLIYHTFHGHVFHGYFGSIKTRFFICVERFLAMITDRIIVLSTQQKNEIGNILKIKNTKFEIIPLGFDLSRFSCEKMHVLKKYGLQDGEAAIGIVGRITNIKNHMLFLDVLAGLKMVNVQFKAFIIGDGELKQEISARAEELFLTGSIIYTGWIQDLVPIYRSLDYLFLTSKNEGTPVAIIEAMAAGVMVVSTNVGGVPDIIQDGINGFLVESQSADDFVKKFHRIQALSLTEKAAVIERAKNTAARFSKEIMLKKIDALFRLSEPIGNVVSKKKIMRIIARLNIGGPTIHIANLCDLNEVGYETYLLYGSVSEHEGDMSYLLKGKIVHLFHIPELGREISIINDIVVFFKILSIIKKIQPDIVHTHTAKAGIIGRIAAKITGVRQIYHTFHGHIFYGYFGKWKTRFFILAERLLVSITTKIIVLSEQQRQEILAILKVSAEKFKIIPLGFDLSHFGRIMDDQHDSQITHKGEINIGIVGRITAIKNHELFIETLSLLNKKGLNFKAYIVGDGELKQNMIELAGLKGIKDQCVFTGWKQDLAPMYSEFDYLFLTSKNEGTPVAVIEAMAAGVIILATAVGGVPDIIIDGKNGFLVKSQTPGDFANCFNEVHALSDAQKIIIRGCAQKSVEQFSIETLLKNIDKLYCTPSMR